MTQFKEKTKILFQNVSYWYLSSPYSNFPKGHEMAYLEAAELTAAMLKVNILVFSPIVHCHHISKRYKFPTDFMFWLRFNEALIDGAYGVLIAMFEGWEKSIGVAGEIDHAQKTGKIRFYLEQELITEMKKEWL